MAQHSPRLPGFPGRTTCASTNWGVALKDAWLRAIALCAALVLTGGGARAEGEEGPPGVLAPRLHVGQGISNVFSISQSVAADGFDEIVRRNGGSGDYLVTRSGPDEQSFDARFRYDGSPTSQGTVVIKAGGATTCWNDSCQPATDASGPVFNRRVWGSPPRRLRRGASWHAPITEPWELAGGGEQIVTVTDFDRGNGCVTLSRTGSSDRPALSERATVKLSRNGKATEFNVSAGTSRWRGLTTFCRGLVRSDELLVVRTDTLSSPEAASVTARRRTIMLLNAAPYPAIGRNLPDD